ncbi:DUF4202 domain-containing protein [Thalassotalea euphylliae]|uniref:DUF4202 domain-containing protein n=1 Tax=Thalassotalea euphylliae TaxID=1655234 RepID=UPI00364052D8
MPSSLDKVLAEIDAINAQDPNLEHDGEKDVAKELLYGQRMSACLAEYWPNANEYVAIAVRAQHIKRWSIARGEYPESKKGYLDWRKALGVMHAELASQLMLENGYSEEEANRTAAIIRKERLKSNEDSQTLEDVACLVFLMYYFAPFAAKHEDDKVVSIVKKTWKKMSSHAQNIALAFTLPEHLGKLVQRALSN